MKILFIANFYPPVKGGMQKYAFELQRELGKQHRLYLIANTRGKFFTPSFFIAALWRSLKTILCNPVDLIILADCTAAPLGWLLKFIFKKRILAIAHGLDLTYDRFGYQALVLPFVRRLDLVVANSTATAKTSREKKIQRFKIIPCGFDTKNFTERLRTADSGIFDKYPYLKNKKIILSVGRLVERKGFFWFAENVLPALGPEYVYVIIGRPMDKARPLLERVEKNPELRERVFFLREIPDKELMQFYQVPETLALVMPNISVENDIEGFGIVALEAGLAGLPVIATSIEGMRTSILSAQMGTLVEEKNINAFLDAIKKAEAQGNTNAREEIIRNFDWEAIGKKWEEVIMV